MANRGPGPIPNRWLHCPRKSDSLIADKFVAFKTPLDERYNDQMTLDCIFPPEMIFSYMKMLKVKLGLWIDLTNTKRFYNREEIEGKDCRYVKLQCRGHGETPSPEQTRSFIDIVDDFINERPIDLIGVHCTHGFNRTGFLIVSYMVEKLDCSVEAALSAFAAARPPGIYKEDYIRELYRRYDDEEDAPPPPEMPDWCFEYDDRVDTSVPAKRQLESPTPTSSNHDNEGEDDENDVIKDPNDAGQSERNPKKKKRRELVKKDATFMPGVSGVKLILDQPRLGTLQQKVQDMCEWESSGFPGSQPVSMDLKNIENLHNQPYRVSWKADGTRYMMLIDKENEVYFFDRDNSCFKVDRIHFLRRENLHQHLENTLLDGEMVIDKVNGHNIPRYLIYDIIKYENDDIGKMPFTKRLDYIKNRIIAPRHEAIKCGLIRRELEPFGVRLKDFWHITQARALLGPKFAQNLSHEPDGLIFQPAIEPYTAGQSPHVLKWKPLTLNSVDFKLRLAEESGQGVLKRKICQLFVGGLELPFALMPYTKAMKDLNNQIIECKFENNRWVFMRQRTDKSYPNSYNTAVSVCNSIKHPVTTEILLDYIDRYRFPDDSEMMPPPPPQRR